MIDDGTVLAAVEARAADAVSVLRFVHAHPELAHAEHACAAHVAAVLEEAGYTVERGIAGLETAFTATFRGALPGRSVGLVCVYDAVAAVRPDGSIDAVHSCGHGPIAGGVVAAALALRDLRERLAGSVVVVGCPADEIHAPGTAAHGGGKALTAAAGVWDGLDAALYAHPELVDTVSTRSRWMRRERLVVPGARSLDGAPEEPLRAAAAVIGANALDVMVERLQVDGDVEEGTGLVARAEVLVFADDETELEERVAALHAASPYGTWTAGPTVRGVRTDERARTAVAEAIAAAGRAFVPDPPPLPFATDFGNISHRCPAALVGIGRPGGWSFHSDAGAEEFASAAGEECARGIAQVLALATARLVEPA